MIENKLAIVIPAYKLEYFEQTLLSIANQTNKNFTLYIGDDNSPFDLEFIIEKYLGKINIVYFRFETNLGGSNLIKQWERCIQLSKKEKWIWLFSDDDLMDVDCVENFYKVLEFTKSYYDLYKFNVQTIDQFNVEFGHVIENPQIESSLDFLIGKLTFKTNSFAVEYIFSKEIYDKSNGFVSFPSAWASDDATWAIFGKEKGIYSISDSKVSWRYSGDNISSVKTKSSRKQKLDAVFQFINWTNTEFSTQIKDKYLIDWAISQSITNSEKKTNFKLSIFFKLFFQTKLKNRIILQCLFISLFSIIKNWLKSIRLFY